MEIAPLFQITHSKAQSFFRCRKQYWYDYLSGIERPPHPESAPGIVGTGVHRAMKQLCDTDEPAVAAHELDVYLRMPAHEIAGPGTEWHARAGECLERGIEAHHSIVSEDRWAEKDTYAPWAKGGISVHARIDRVDRLGENHWQIIDWKTGRIDNDDTTDAQLDLGHVALRTTLRSAVRTHATVTAIAWNLRNGQQRVRRLVRDDAAATLRKFAAVAVRIQGTTEFMPTPGTHCGFCRWQEICPDSAAAAHEWDDIDPEPAASADASAEDDD